MSRHNELLVKQFLDRNIQYFSAESLNNAAKYFDKDTRSHYRALRRS